MKKTISMLLCCLLLCALAACGGGQTSGELTLTDSYGTAVTLEKPAEKIVSLSPNVTETIYALGAGSTLLGRSTWCNYPAEAAEVESVGDPYTGINIERIIELDPDIVIVTGTTAVSALSELTNLNIPVFGLEFATVDDIYTALAKLGTITGKTADADTITTKLKSDLAALKEQCASTEKRKVFLDLGDLYSSSKVDFLGNLFTEINAENIAYDYDYTSPQLSAEKVIEANPDVYIVTSSEEFFNKPAGFDEISAFKNNEVYYIPYEDPRCDMITRPSPRFVEGLKLVAQMIHPELSL